MLQHLLHAQINDYGIKDLVPIKFAGKIRTNLVRLVMLVTKVQFTAAAISCVRGRTITLKK